MGVRVVTGTVVSGNNEVRMLSVLNRQVSVIYSLSSESSPTALT